MADKPKITLEQGQRIAISITLSNGTRIPTQGAIVGRVSLAGKKSAILNLKDKSRVEIVT
jgi:hypothetical protein